MTPTWREKLTTGEFTTRDTGFWETCAVGEQAALHPEVVGTLDTYSGPRDPVLHRLGREFHEYAHHALDAPGVSAVEPVPPADAIAHMHMLLDQIEDRVLVLKREAGR